MSAPTFHEKVGIPVHGGDPVDVDFEFKHRTRTEFAAFCKELDEKTAAANTDDALDEVHVWYVMQVAVSWGLDDAFSVENVKALLQSYQGALWAIGARYTFVLVRVHANESVERTRRELYALISPPTLN